MPTSPPRTPPRFVPTLTDVVAEGSASTVPPALPSERASTKPAPTMVTPATALSQKQSMPLPARPVPTAMVARPAVAAPGVARAPASQGLAKPAAGAPSVSLPRPVPPPAGAKPSTPAPRTTGQPPRTVPDGLEEMIVHRVMQRVDVMLETRLRDAIATVVQEQTRSILPRLREEVESVVRQSVYEAVADELASAPPAA